MAMRPSPLKSLFPLLVFFLATADTGAQYGMTPCDIFKFYDPSAQWYQSQTIFESHIIIWTIHWWYISDTFLINLLSNSWSIHALVIHWWSIAKRWSISNPCWSIFDQYFLVLLLTFWYFDGVWNTRILSGKQIQKIQGIVNYVRLLDTQVLYSMKRLLWR